MSAYAIKTYLNTYPEAVQIHVKRLKKTRKCRHIPRLEEYISNVIPKFLDSDLYLRDLLLVDVQLLDSKRLTMSKIFRVAVPFENNPRWYDEMCETFGVSRWYAITPSKGQESIRGMTREEFSNLSVVYGVLAKPESSAWFGHTAMVPNHYREDKKHIFYQWVLHLIESMNAYITTLLSQMKLKQFQTFVTHREAIPMLGKFLNAFTTDARNFAVLRDPMVTSLEALFIRYLHLRDGEKSVADFMLLLDVYYMQPLQFVLYNCKMQLSDYITMVHSVHMRKNIDPGLTEKDFGQFWKMMCSKLAKNVATELIEEDRILTYLIDPSQSTSSILFAQQRAVMKRVCEFVFRREMYANHDHTNPTIYMVDDEYNNYYNGILMPLLYTYMMNSNQLPPIKALMRFLTETPFGVMMLRSHQQYLSNEQWNVLRRLTDEMVVVDSDGTGVVCLVQWNTHERPRLFALQSMDVMIHDGRLVYHLKDGRDRFGDVFVSPTTGEWYTYEKSTTTPTLRPESTLLGEYRHKKYYYLFEIASIRK
jgi:hypothetical protein